jgi:hypothetical protein
MTNSKRSGARPGKPMGSPRVSVEAGGLPTPDGRPKIGSAEKRPGPRAPRLEKQRPTTVADRGRTRKEPRRSRKVAVRKRPEPLT